MLRQSAAILGAFALAFAAQLPFFDRWFSFMDEGHMLLFADLVAKGGTLYRDATVYPLPGAFWLLAAAFRVFGASNLVARWLVVVEFALIVALAFALVRRIAGARAGWLAVAAMLLHRVWAFPHWHMFNYSSTALLVQLAALALLLHACDSGRRAWLAAAGLAFGLGVLCKQDYGAMALVAFTATLAAHAWSAPPPRPRLAPLLATFLAPAALVGAAAGLHFWRAGVLRDVLRFTVTNHFVGMSTYAYSSFPGLLPLLAPDPLLRDDATLPTYMPAIVYLVDWDALRESRLFRETPLYELAMKLYYHAPWLLIAFGAARLVRRRAELAAPGTRRARLAELGLFAFAASLLAWAHVNKPQDYVHLAILYGPMLLLIPIWLRDARARLRRAHPRAAAAALAALAVPALAFAGYSVHLALGLRALHDTPLPSARAGLRVTAAQAELLGDALGWIEAHAAPGATIAVLPYFPILHFLADRPGPDRSAYIVWPFPELADRDRRIVESFERTRPEVLLYAFNRLGDFPDVRDYAPELYAYLVERYELERVFSADYLGYKLGGALRVAPDAAAPGRPLASELLAGALALRAEDEPPRAIPPEERGAWLAPERWPFRPVLALRPAAGGARTSLTVPLDVPPGARLRSAVAVHPDAWYEHPSSWVRFEIFAEEGEDRSSLFERTLNPTGRVEDRGWTEVDLPLARWAGRRVRLTLATSAERPTGSTLAHGGFAEPELVVDGDAGEVAP